MTRRVLLAAALLLAAASATPGPRRTVPDRGNG